LQTGVIDGAENNPPSFVFDNHYQAAKYYTLTEHLIVPEMLVLSRKTWDGLTKDDQALLTKLAREAQQEERVLWAKYEQQALDKAKAAGVTIVELADKKPFEDAVPVGQIWPAVCRDDQALQANQGHCWPVSGERKGWRSVTAGRWTCCTSSVSSSPAWRWC
jgi:TRAP-type C4-dicarboxylate transport system substrate-binding protein